MQRRNAAPENASVTDDLSRGDAVLLSHPLIDDACCFSVPDEAAGEHLACAVVARAGSNLRRAHIRVFAARFLAASDVPVDICYVSSVPRSPTGRARRKTLAQQVLAERATGLPTAQATSRIDDLSPMELQLLELWRGLLNAPTLHPDEDFFRAGGNEAQAQAMLLKVKSRFALRYRLLYENFAYEPTIFCLAEMIQYGEEMRAPQPSAQQMRIVPVRVPEPEDVVSKNRPLLYLLPPDGDEGTCFRKLSDTLGPEWPVSVVRPAGLLHRTGPYQFEEAARECAELIRSDSAGRPFAVGGFCYGGLLAAEIARLLEKECMALVVFDTPLPGHPHYPFRLRWTKDHVRWLRSTAAALRRRGGPRFVADRVARVTLWHSLRILKPALAPIWNTAAVQAVTRRASFGDFPFFTQLKRVEMPVLHLYSTDHQSVFWQQGVLDWHQVAPQVVAVPCLSGAHLSLFFGKNLRQMANSLQTWFDCRGSEY